MPFDKERFMAWQPSQAELERARRDWQCIILGMESVRASDRLAALAAERKMRRPREGSKAWRFLQLLIENPDMPAARINAMLPEPMDDATARKLAREWRGFV
jgi:hypothetical protein